MPRYILPKEMVPLPESHRPTTQKAQSHHLSATVWAPKRHGLGGDKPRSDDLSATVAPLFRHCPMTSLPRSGVGYATVSPVICHCPGKVMTRSRYLYPRRVVGDMGRECGQFILPIDPDRKMDYDIAPGFYSIQIHVIGWYV